MLNFNKLCVFDFETTGQDPNYAQPCSMAGVMIDPRKLTLCENGLFYSMCSIVPDEEVEKYNLKPVEQRALEVNKLKIEDILAAKPLKQVWGDFTNWVNYHNPKKEKWSAPIFCGQNCQYDLKIMNRLINGHLSSNQILIEKLPSKKDIKSLSDEEASSKYKNLKIYKEPWKYGPDWLFHPAYTLDTMQFSFAFFESFREPKKIGQDTIKDFLGFPSNGHHALTDALYTAEILIRYLKLIREVSKETDFATEGRTLLPINKCLDIYNVQTPTIENIEVCPF